MCRNPICVDWHKSIEAQHQLAHHIKLSKANEREWQEERGGLQEQIQRLETRQTELRKEADCLQHVQREAAHLKDKLNKAVLDNDAMYVWCLAA